MKLHALALNCTLKRSAPAYADSPADDSSTDLMLRRLADAMAEHDVETDHLRVVDHDVFPGVSADEGPGDEWPEIRARVLDADIIVMGTPIWMGAPSSVCKRVAERLDAMLSEDDGNGRMPTTGKVAVVAVVGNEDGAHHVAAECFQWLNDVGFTIPANGSVYWVGEAMGSVDYKDLDPAPDKVGAQIRLVASNAAHLAAALANSPYLGRT
jgi:multimeric flavodoxin WrbA